MNENPHQARTTRKKKRKPGDLKALAGKVWSALETAEEVLSSDDTAERLRACHALFQGATAYAKVLEVGELEARLEALEAAQAQVASAAGPRLRGAA